MMNKRLTLELPYDEYEALRKRAGVSGETVSGLMRKLVHDYNRRPKKMGVKDYKDDPVYKMGASFSGPGDLSENHDDYLYYGKGGGKSPL